MPTYINYTTVFQVKNTFFGLLIPSLLMNAFNVMLVKSYFITSIPEEILESARMDGAGEIRIFVSISAPMARPIIATIALFVGIAYWNDWNNYFNSVMLINDQDNYSLQMLLFNIQSEITAMSRVAQGATRSNPPGESFKMAACVVTMGPIILLYPFLQKYFVKGMVVGAVKG